MSEHPSTKKDRNAEIVAAIERGEHRSDVAQRHGITPERVTAIVGAAYLARVGALQPPHGPPRHPRPPRPSRPSGRPTGLTWPDGTPMHELQVVLLRLFALLPDRLDQVERDALIGTIRTLFRGYYRPVAP